MCFNGFKISSSEYDDVLKSCLLSSLKSANFDTVSIKDVT